MAPAPTAPKRCPAKIRSQRTRFFNLCAELRRFKSNNAKKATATTNRRLAVESSGFKTGRLSVRTMPLSKICVKYLRTMSCAKVRFHPGDCNICPIRGSILPGYCAGVWKR